MTDIHAEIPVKSAYRQRLSEMLDLTYELEGLLHIGVVRTTVPPRLNHLIVSKLNAIVALADEPPAPHEQVMAAEERTADVENPPVPVDSDVMAEEEADAPSETGYYSDDPEEDVNGDGDPDAGEGAAEDMPDTPEYEEAETERVPAGGADNPPVPDELPKDSAVARQNEQKSNGRLFSINDRFLYARELFGGKVSDFDRALNEVITFDSPEEAEEYFISEWNFDPENPVATEFLETIRKIF